MVVAGVGTVIGAVTELYGGRPNGKSCPKANLTTYEKWIEKLNPILKMADIVLPGVHHHGLVEDASEYIGIIPGGKVLDWAVTQSLSVADQLKTGARFLDIRLTEYEGRLCTAHGQASSGLVGVIDKKAKVTVGVPFNALLNVNIEFLKKNRREFLVWNLRWEYGTPQWGRVREILKKHHESFYSSSDNPMGRKLIDLAGKIIMCYEGKNNSLTEYRKLPCHGSWRTTQQKEPWKLVEKLREYIKTPQYPRGKIFNFVEAIATTDGVGIAQSIDQFTEQPTDLKDLACRVNKVLKDAFLIKAYREYADNFHAVMVDYSVYHQVIPGILEFNKYKNKIRLEGKEVINIESKDKGRRYCKAANLAKHRKWIEHLNPKLKLKDLVLPGVHHSGLVEGKVTYEGAYKHLSQGGWRRLPWAVTQSLVVMDQLNTGVRFLDLRLTVLNRNIYTAHGTTNETFTSGALLLSLINDNIEFLRINNKEFIVWSLTWEYGKPEWARVEDLLDDFRQHFYTSSDNPMGEELPVLYGKIIICNNGESNLPTYRRLPCVSSWSITRQGDASKLVENIIMYSSGPQYPIDAAFNYVEAVATGKMVRAMDLKDMACKVNKKLKESFLTKYFQVSEFIHAVMVDYSAYHDVVPLILEFNNFKNKFRESLAGIGRQDFSMGEDIWGGQGEIGEGINA